MFLKMCFIVTVASITSRDAKISTFFNTVVQQGKLASWPGIPFSIPKQKPYIQYKIVSEKFPALMADSIVGSADVFKILNFSFLISKFPCQLTGILWLTVQRRLTAYMRCVTVSTRTHAGGYRSGTCGGGGYQSAAARGRTPSPLSRRPACSAVRPA